MPESIDKKLERTLALLEALVVLEYSKTDLSQAEIGKHMKIDLTKINSILKGTKKKGKNNE